MHFYVCVMYVFIYFISKIIHFQWNWKNEWCEHFVWWQSEISVFSWSWSIMSIVYRVNRGFISPTPCNIKEAGLHHVDILFCSRSRRKHCSCRLGGKASLMASSGTAVTSRPVQFTLLGYFHIGSSVQQRIASNPGIYHVRPHLGHKLGMSLHYKKWEKHLLKARFSIWDVNF